VSLDLLIRSSWRSAFRVAISRNHLGCLTPAAGWVLVADPSEMHELPPDRVSNSHPRSISSTATPRRPRFLQPRSGLLCSGEGALLE